MSKTRLFPLLLTLILISWLVYRCTPTKIEHEGYRFELPMDFEEAITQFGMDSLNPQMAVRFDDRRWLTNKAISDYPYTDERVVGLNFYYDDTVDIKAVMQRIEQQFEKKSQSGEGIYTDPSREWWYLQVNNNVQILVYCHTYVPYGVSMKGEDYCEGGGEGQGRQWVVAFTDRLYRRSHDYIFYDGMIDEYY